MEREAAEVSGSAQWTNTLAAQFSEDFSEGALQTEHDPGLGAVPQTTRQMGQGTLLPDHAQKEIAGTQFCD